MLLSSKNTRMIAPPPGLRQDSGFGSSDSDDDSVGIMPLGGMKNMLKRQDTFYDVNYEEVKVSTVPQTKEGWDFFMDLLKTEHRKFKLLLTNLRIERMKILKEMEIFSNSFNEIKVLIKNQFETSMVDLRNVNVARLLNGEINKRSSSYIKTKASPPKAIHKTIRTNKPVSSTNSALNSVREAFGAIEEDSDNESGDQSVKSSTNSERLNRSKVTLVYDVDTKLEVIISISIILCETVVFVNLLICFQLRLHSAETNYARNRWCPHSMSARRLLRQVPYRLRGAA